MSSIGDKRRIVPDNKGRMAVKNKMPSDQQITAEQILREATERAGSGVLEVPNQKIMDEDELEDYRVRKRKEFEDQLRRQRHQIGEWVKYALWEANQQEFRRARSIFERALQVDYKSTPLWLKYVEFEMKHKFINHARNIFDRVCSLLPRIDQFWYKFAYMEELLGNYGGARTVYERWMSWEPDDNGWYQYIKFEDRCGELDRARLIFEKYVSVRPSTLSFGRLVKFEEKYGNTDRCRAGFEKAIEILAEEVDQNFFIKFAAFEEREKEMERARVIYRLALERLPKGEGDELYRKYVSFEKQHGDQDGIEDVVVNKRRFHYEELLKQNSKNYDAWFDYIRLEESVGELDKIRELYERSVAEKPPIAQKRYWRRYIYLWINYALCEEMIAKDVERTRAVYDAMITIVPHKHFSFSKIWQRYADFEVRQLNVDIARKIYGRAIGECKKQKIFHHYAELELRLGNIDRCRKIYERFIELHPYLPKAWISYVDLEEKVGEFERARHLCALAISQEQLDMPELVWKRFIDLNIANEHYEEARTLYARLLQKSRHIRIYKSFADFEKDCGDIESARTIIKEGLDRYKDEQKNEERAQLLDHWIECEKDAGTTGTELDELVARRPKKVRRRKLEKIGDEEVEHEYIDYIFPEDSSKDQNARILQMAYMWKKKKLEASAPKGTIVDQIAESLREN